MGYTVTFGITQKKVNSTSQNFAIQHSGVSCSLKAPCDILAPTLTFQGAFDERCNYMFVLEWSKYFWITAAVFDKGHWEITGKCDVMATYKTDIGTTSAYVSRCAGASRAKLFPDSMIMSMGIVQRGEITHAMGFSTTGSYIVTVAGQNGSMFWALDEASYQALYSEVFSAGFCSDLLGVWNDIVNGSGSIFSNLTLTVRNEFINPAQYIQSVIWVPFDLTSGQPMGRIKAGFTPVSTGHPFSPAQIVYFDSFTMAVPAHPQADAYGDWLNTGMGRRASLSIPGIGTVDLDLSGGSTSSTVIVTIGCDCTGTLYARVNQVGISRLLSGNIGVDVGLAMTRTNITGSITNVATGAAQLAAGNPLGAAGIVNAATSLIPSIDTIASGGSRALPSVAPNVILSYAYTTVSGTDDASIGRPECATRQLGLLSGYILCQNARVQSSNATYAEKNEIDGYLNGGFYYE